MSGIMARAALGAVTPVPVSGLVCKGVLVMTRLHGHKVTDHLALGLLGVDKQALLVRVAHSCAWQLLVAGTFNGDAFLVSSKDFVSLPHTADPHAGNIMFCLAKSSDSDALGDVVPGLLDFGMTVRLAAERRRAYCRLVVALFEGDTAQAGAELSAIGYRSTQSGRAPERDAEFFEFLLRDANVSSCSAPCTPSLFAPLTLLLQPKAVSREQRDQFNALRVEQKRSDIAAGVREKGGRQISQVPEEFVFLTRVIGLLRGLAAELDCDCPILHILALNARIGMHS